MNKELIKRITEVGCYSEGIEKMTKRELYKYLGVKKDSFQRLSNEYLKSTMEVCSIQEEILKEYHKEKGEER